MNAIIDAAISRARTVLSILVLILGAGLVSYLTIPKESAPDIAVPILYVSMSHEGISPEDAERLLVRPMEQELRAVEGVREMRSTAKEGFASVLLEFDAGFDSDQALTDVREKVDLVKPELPDDTDEPTVHEVNVGLFPVLVITLSGEVPERALIATARDLKDELESLPGVLSADLAGDRDELLEVVIDPMRLETYNIGAAELYSAVAQNNRLIAAGALDSGKGRFSVKVPGLFDDPSDVLNLPIKSSGDGVVALKDVTTVRRTFKDATSFARVNGRPAVTIEIRKRLGENIIETIADVRGKVAEMRARWPAGIEVGFTQDESNKIRNMLEDLQNNVLSAVLLVMIVVVAALGLRTAGLVGLAIPASFLFGMLVLHTIGLTVNIVVLFSMILAVGMLVDGAIVVTEYADRKMSEGLHRREAYRLAAKRMAWPISASTATTLAAFMPLLFWPDVVGEFMKFLPITLIATLAGSLVTALLFVPTLGGMVGKPGSADPNVMRGLAAAESGDLGRLPGLTGVYARALGTLIRHPVKIVALAFALLIGVQSYYWTHGNGVEFFPEVEPEQSLIYVQARGNLSTLEKDALVREVEAQVLQVAGIETVYARTGAARQGEEAAEDVIGTIFIEYDDWSARRPAAQILREIRERTLPLAGIAVETRQPKAGPPVGKDIQIELRTREPSRLEPMVRLIRDQLRAMDGLIAVEDTRALPGIELELELEQARAARYGVDTAAVGNMVKLVTNGIKVGEYRPDDADEEVEIRVRFPLDRRHMGQLDELRIGTDRGAVPIGNFINQRPKAKTGTLRRNDGQRTVTIRANVTEGLLADDKVREIRAWLATQELDPAVFVRFKGADDKQKKAETFLAKAFAIAIFVMAIILVTQFNSFYHAFLILTAVIMSTVGVILGLIVTGQTFGIVMTGIGIIALAGIVVNNNIVLIDTYARLKESGVAPLEAIVRTGAQRLRPVLLTTVTTIFGLMPMVFQLNIDFFARSLSQGAPSTQWWVQLATAVAFGLGFATVLTLVVTPCLLALGVKFGAVGQVWRVKRYRKAAPGGKPQAAE
ncbi:MAG: efflux RND transporter permease subunit [Alphaproteobacteria bacterium]|jgi:multidrug efflux pump|nr:efflux RND transporter permease subunit [Alphaproteobacteria bacterium]